MVEENSEKIRSRSYQAQIKQTYFVFVLVLVGGRTFTYLESYCQLDIECDCHVVLGFFGVFLRFSLVSLGFIKSLSLETASLYVFIKSVLLESLI